jgi:hypothetical protein
VLYEEGGQFGLRDHRKLRVCPADVPFPVRVLRGVGRCGKQTWMWSDAPSHGKRGTKPLVAGLEYLSGREPGGGCRFRVGRGRPLDISGSTATASPAQGFNDEFSAQQSENRPTEFLPKALRAEMIKSMVSDPLGGHRRRCCAARPADISQVGR